MPKYIFILGQSSELARQEIISVLNKQKIGLIATGSNFAISETDQPPQQLINALGGTIKIARLIDSINDLSQLTIQKWEKYLNLKTTTDKKIHFGFSLYNDNQKNYKEITNVALQLKKILKNQNHKIRLVTGRQPELSSVIVAKNHLLNTELIIIKHDFQYFLGMTEAVQDFIKYGQRDIARPCRDSRSGMLPPKVAQMMINLAGPARHKIILDPFCGSGTILQEAMLLGFKKIYGSDLKQSAVDNTTQNIHWLKETFSLSSKEDIKKIDVKNLSQFFSIGSIDLIVTEPFLGEAGFIHRQKDIQALEETKRELQQLYYRAFQEFYKILKPQGQIVFVFPIFNIGEKQLFTLDKKISQLGFCLQLKLPYSRPGQKVARQITMWQKK